MGYPKNLKDLTTHAAAEKDILQALTQAIKDHGGNIEHWRKLLSDTKADNCYLSDLAKRLVGTPWELTQEAFKLLTMSSDIGKTAEEMAVRGRIVCHNASRVPWESSDPVSGPHYYKLLHIPGTPSYKEALNMCSPKEGIYHADIRALVAFQKKIEYEELTGHFAGISVYALGARGKLKAADIDGFPYVSGPSMGICLSEEINDSQFPFPKSKSFALVRLKD